MYTKHSLNYAIMEYLWVKNFVWQMMAIFMSKNLKSVSTVSFHYH